MRSLPTSRRTSREGATGPKAGGLAAAAAALAAGFLAPAAPPASAFPSGAPAVELQAGGAAEAPEFPRRDGGWINSPPLRMADLRGRVVLLDVWTFG